MRSLNPSLLAVFLVAGAGPLAAQTVRVVNMVPGAQSNETNQDSEPDITVDPNDPNNVVASAFTPNPTGALGTAPIYISSDRGNTWLLNSIVPSGNGMTGDITVALGRNGVLYAGILRGGSSLLMDILRTANYTGAAAMTTLVSRNNVDQPFARMLTGLGGGERDDDLVYVGNNDLATALSATVDQSFDAATAPAPGGFAASVIELRPPFMQDAPPIRPAIHHDGTVYAAFARYQTFTATLDTVDIVVARDDDWGKSATPFSDLTDPSDGLAGRFVAQGISVAWLLPGLGQERVGERLSIAVDPTDSQTVYLAYYDSPSGTDSRVQIRRSTDGGNNWSGSLLSVASALNPTVAVTVRGKVGFAYQVLTGAGAAQRWETHLRTSDDGGATWDDTTLATTPAATPVRAFFPYLGDYMGLAAVGKDFYGVFSANNTPDPANFPNGVTYQRNVDWTANTLRNLANTGTVAVSIDPFFFHVQEIPDDQDFYVRDWTDSATDNDAGLEPSTDPIFFTTSDVWNRRTDAPAPFSANDRPQSEDPQVAVLGDNYAFARVHRKGSGSAETVTLRFLKSEFGTGSNYVDVSATPTDTLTFAAADTVQTMTAGVEWTLNATTSSHTCLAVEITTPNDPLSGPSLVGRAPGWPPAGSNTRTDLIVLNDNNIAQRNMGVHKTSGRGSSIAYHALVHNAALATRDVTLRVIPDERFVGLFKQPVTGVVGGAGRMEGDLLTLPGMRPGENRWVALAVPATSGQGGALYSVSFQELVDGLAVNGFTIAVEPTTVAGAAPEALRLYAEAFLRLGALEGDESAAREGKRALELAGRGEVSPKALVELLRDGSDRQRGLDALLKRPGFADLFGLSGAADRLSKAAEAGDPELVLPGTSDLAQRLDSALTRLDKLRGDLADVRQTVDWQAELYATHPRLCNLPGSAELVERSREFVLAFSAGKVTADDYPGLVEGLFDVYAATVGVVGESLQAELEAMRGALGSAKELQGAHRRFLLLLEAGRR
ncbi:MAG: sialidase family protein [Planctomycetota bacterium]